MLLRDEMNQEIAGVTDKTKVGNSTKKGKKIKFIETEIFGIFD